MGRHDGDDDDSVEGSHYEKVPMIDSQATEFDHRPPPYRKTTTTTPRTRTIIYGLGAALFISVVGNIALLLSFLRRDLDAVCTKHTSRYCTSQRPHEELALDEASDL